MKIGITMGDCAGVGPEIILKALVSNKIGNDHDFIIYGDYEVFKEINEKFKIFSNGIDGIDFVDLNLVKTPVEFGTIKAEYGKAAGEYIKKAIEDALDNKINAVVTAPIHKKSFQMGGFGKKYAGHTEMFADLTNTKDYTMMLAYENLRVVHVSTHVSMREAIDMVTKDNVYNKIKIAYETCKKLNIKDIKIAVAGLNPHAGDSGLFGDEEINEIMPAIEKAREDFDCAIQGPCPSDTVFSKAYGGGYDMVVTMYHDQGHIPMKTLGFKYDHQTSLWTEVKGVNVTLGLPIIRSSVDHGTAFGKAGKGTASEDSIIDAIDYAQILAK